MEANLIFSWWQHVVRCVTHLFGCTCSKIQGMQSGEGKGQKEPCSNTGFQCVYTWLPSPSLAPCPICSGLLGGDSQHLETLAWHHSSKKLGVEVRTQMQFIFLC